MEEMFKTNRMWFTRHLSRLFIDIDAAETSALTKFLNNHPAELRGVKVCYCYFHLRQAWSRFVGEIEQDPARCPTVPYLALTLGIPDLCRRAGTPEARTAMPCCAKATAPLSCVPR